jgi:hypothetical protein
VQYRDVGSAGALPYTAARLRGRADGGFCGGPIAVFYLLRSQATAAKAQTTAGNRSKGAKAQAKKPRSRTAFPAELERGG